MELNYDKRTLMFSMISAVEFDIKDYLLESEVQLDFTEEMKEKISFRLKEKFDDNSSIKIKLDNLDLSDFLSLLMKTMKNSRADILKNDLKFLKDTLLKIIPIRNRVVHAKPLLETDYENIIELFFVRLPQIKAMNFTYSNSIRFKLLNSDSEGIIQLKTIPEFRHDIKTNLPAPDFDDTGFIGREKEMKDITNAIIDNRFPVVSIVGTGGFGKTATLLNCLYNLIESEKNPYKRIVWTSLKTATIANGDFVEILNVIASLEGVFVQSGLALGISQPSELNLINELAKEETLLVIDNLETMKVDTKVINFIKNLPSSTKLVITSRDGLGELENRYDFGPMNKLDAKTYYKKLAKALNLIDVLSEGERTTENILIKLNYSPLSIKWYLTNLSNGGRKSDTLNNQGELLDYCMSNVYEKLSDDAKELLHILLIERQPLSYGELLYFTEMKDIQSLVNELLKTYMITRFSDKIKISDMTIKYLSSKIIEDVNLYSKIKKMRRQLNAMIQEIRVNNTYNPFDPKSLKIDMTDIDEVLCAYHLRKIFNINYKLNENRSKVDKLISTAQSIKPDYFEIYKIKGYVYAGVNNFLAEENYVIALRYARSLKEKAYVQYMYASFYAFNDIDPYKAEDMIHEVEKIVGELYEVDFAKARIYLYNGKYEETQKLLGSLTEKSENIVSLGQKNKIIKLYADYYKKMAERLDYKDYSEKLKFYIKAVDKIEESEKIDKKLYISLSNILKDITYLPFDSEVIYLIEYILSQYYQFINSFKEFKVIRRKILENKHKYKEEDFSKIALFIRNLREEAKCIEIENEGIILVLKDGFGFIGNYQESNYYFKVHELNGDIKLGDRVKFLSEKSDKGPIAKKIVKVV